VIATNGGPVAAGTIGEAVRRARLARDWSQEFLAEKVGTDQTTISQIERGRFRPKYETVLALAGAFGIEPEGWVELAGYRVTGGERVATAPDDLPPGIVALLREMVRQYPELETQFAANRRDADFQAQVRTLARVLGFTAREWFDNEPGPV
jgi:transcriptional regulator with XRE-family HTH domain